MVGPEPPEPDQQHEHDPSSQNHGLGHVPNVASMTLTSIRPFLIDTLPHQLYHHDSVRAAHAPEHQSLEMTSSNDGSDNDDHHQLLSHTSSNHNNRRRDPSSTTPTIDGDTNMSTPPNEMIIPIESEARARHDVRVAMTSDLPECSICCVGEALEKLTTTQRILIAISVIIIVIIIVTFILETK
jgi:hypothetical protein